MQSSRSLLVLGIGTAVVVGSVGAAPGQAAPLASHRPADAAVVSPTSEKPTDQSAKPDPLAESAAKSDKTDLSAQLDLSAKPDLPAKSNLPAKPDLLAKPNLSTKPDRSEPLIVSVQPVPVQAVASQNPTLEVNPTSAQPMVQFSSSKAETETIAAQPKPDDKPAAVDLTQAVTELVPDSNVSGFNAPAAQPQANQSQPAQSQPHRNRASQRRANRHQLSQAATPESTPQSTPAADPAPATPAQASDAKPSDAKPSDAKPSDAKPSDTPSGTTPSANPPSMEFTPGAPDSTTPAPPVIPTQTETSNEPAPDYLNPDPNPLSFPTTPEEVKIEGTQPITLKQAIELAVRNTRSLQEARLNVENNQAQLREAEAANFPTLDLSSNLVVSGQEAPRTQQQTIDPQTGLPTGGGGFNGTSFPNSSTLQTTVEGSYQLFTSGVRSAQIKAAREQVTFNQLQLESATEQLILDVTNNYYDLQNADEQVRIAQDSVTQAQQSLRDSQALERAGVGTRFDVLQSQVDLANSQQTLTQNISNQQVAQRQLVQQLALSQTVNITAADPIQPAGVWTLPLEDTIVLAFKNRAELEQLLVQRDIAEQNRRRALGSIRPQITANASYGVGRTLDDSNDPVFNGFLSNFSASIGLRWRLFDGGAARAQADQQKTNGAIAENRFAEQREQIRFNVEQGYSVLQSSYSNIQVTTLAVQQAQEALRLARLRFQAGVGTQTDVLQQQTALTQAEVNRLTAILNYNRALATLNREVSNYPGGNLADTP